MNVHPIAGKDVRGTLGHYFAAAIPMTVTTIWAIIAFQVHHIDNRLKTWKDRLLWPIRLPRALRQRARERKTERITDEESLLTAENADL